MDREGCRSPAGTGRMTGFTRSWYAKRPMVGVYRLVVIGLMATHAGVGGVIVISTLVAAVAIYSGVSA